MGIIEIQTLIHYVNTYTPLSKFFSLYYKNTIIVGLTSNCEIECHF